MTFTLVLIFIVALVGWVRRWGERDSGFLAVVCGMAFGALFAEHVLVPLIVR